METQWPRYYVFERPNPSGDFIHAGSVHAPDPEMALLIARDVFARRPARTAMWVVPDSSIFSRTAEELAVGPATRSSGDRPARTYQVFAKTSQKGVCVHHGWVEADGPEAALSAALAAFPETKALVWWLAPDAAITKSVPGEASLLYDSSPGKGFRHESHYPVRTMMRAIMARAKKSKKDEPDD